MTTTTCPVLAQAALGSLYGKVSDATTGRPVPDCKIRLLPADTAITSDSTGRFRVDGLAPGTYRAIFIKPGFEAIENSNIVVGPGTAEEVVGRLHASVESPVLELADKNAHGSAPKLRAREREKAGTFQYGRNDVLRAPGALQDISLFAQSLPGVMRGNDQKTDLSVRGGGSDENAYLIDGIPVFNINHFENNNRSGGGIGNINTYFLENVDFHTGGFSARFPDRLSSVMDISFKRGNPDYQSGMAMFDAAGMGGLLEGPLPGTEGKATFGLSVRASSLSMLDKLGLIKFGGVPKYENAHLKVNYPVADWDISLNVLGGMDGFESDYPSGSLEMAGADTARYQSQEKDYQYTDNLFGGLRATRLYNASRISLFAAGNTRHFRNENDDELILLSGSTGPFSEFHSQAKEKSGGNRVLWGMDWERFLNANWTIRLGGLQDYDRPELQTLDVANYRVGTIDSVSRKSESRQGEYYTLGLFSEAEFKNGPWEATGGVRILHDEYTGGTFAGPRFGLNRSVGNQIFRGAFGAHTQSPAAELFGHAAATGSGRLPYNLQSILGWDGTHGFGLSSRVELFDKEGFQMLRFGKEGSARDTCRTLSRGIDIYLRKSLRNQAWGSASYTYAWNRDQLNGKWVRNAFSIPHSLSAALGYDIGRNLATSVHFGFASGSPFSLSPTTRYSETRDPYLRLDTRVEYRYAFAKATLATFLEITNLTDHVNVFTKDEYDVNYGWGFFPVGGFTLSF